MYIPCPICKEMVVSSDAGMSVDKDIHQHIKITFTYAADTDLGPQPEDVSIHYVDNPQSARNLTSYNMTNKGLISITVEFDKD